jgi:hypothetical protein
VDLADHRLLPHERMFANWARARQRTHRTVAIQQLESNYGPVGLPLLGAAIASALPAAVLALAVFVLIFVSGEKGTLWEITLGIMGLVLVLVVLVWFRCWQCARAGKKFRAGRPFSRRRRR